MGEREIKDIPAYVQNALNNWETLAFAAYDWYEKHGRLVVGIEEDPTDCLLKPVDIQKVMKDRLNNPDYEKIRLHSHSFNFVSNSTGSSYIIKPVFDEEFGKHFITIDCFKAFNIGSFGSIKMLDSTIDELVDILDKLSGHRKKQETVIVHISVKPREKIEKNQKGCNHFFK